MKKHLLSAFAVGLAFTSFAQDVSKTLIGSSYNMYSVLSPSTNAVASSDALGVISFTHRQNADLEGGSGIIQTSYSKDDGATWEYILTSDSTQTNRYPSGLLVDPSGANNLADAHAVVLGPSLVGGAWGGIYTNNVAFDGSESRMNVILDTESDYPSFSRTGMTVDDSGIIRVSGYNNNGIDLVITTGEYDADGQGSSIEQYATYAQYFAGGSFGAGSGVEAGDTIWYMTSENPDLYVDGAIDSAYTNEIRLINYEMVAGVHTAIDTVDLGWNNVAYHEDSAGAWNPVISEADSFYVQGDGIINTLEITGTAGYYWTQVGLVAEGLVELYDWSMAFSTDGATGYAVAQGTDTSGQIVPFVHMTTDGGSTWTQQDLDFTALGDYVAPAYNGGIDCAVDANGDLHMICSVFEQDDSVEETNRMLYDIVTDGSTWVGNFIANINTERVADEDAAAIYGIGYNHRIQAAKSEDETKIFAVWTDVNIDEFEVDLLEFPDVYAYGIDVNNNTSTAVTNFTAGTAFEGDNFWMFTSAIAKTTDGGWTLPTTTSVAGPSELEAMEHYYLGGISFSNDDFLAIEDVQANIAVNVFPNPATTVANIEISLDNTSDVAISLVNTLGQEVYNTANNYRSGLNTVSIDVKDMEAGVYFYTVSSENFSVTKRLIVE